MFSGSLNQWSIRSWPQFLFLLLLFFFFFNHFMVTYYWSSVIIICAQGAHFSPLSDHDRIHFEGFKWLSEP